MYNPVSFQELRPDILCAAIAEHPLAALVTSGADGLHATHIPLLYTPSGGILRGHMAQANQHWRDAVPPCEALAIFTGPQHYISPNWYPSKHDDGKVVPTWNYIVVHAHCTLAIKDDPGGSSPTSLPSPTNRKPPGQPPGASTSRTSSRPSLASS